MLPLTDIEKQILRVIRRWQETYRNSPSAAELARELGRSISVIQYTLYRLQKKGYIDLVKPDRRVLVVPLIWE